MQGVYTFQYQITGVNSARTLLYLAPPSTQAMEILSAKVTQTNVTASEQLECMVSRIATIGGPTATTISPTLTEPTTPAFGGTAKANVTASEPTYGSVQIDQNGWPNVGGYFYDPLPEERVIIAPGAYVGLKLLSTPSNTYTLDCTMTVRCIG